MIDCSNGEIRDALLAIANVAEGDGRQQRHVGPRRSCGSLPRNAGPPAHARHMSRRTQRDPTEFLENLALRLHTGAHLEIK